MRHVDLWCEEVGKRIEDGVSGRVALVAGWSRGIAAATVRWLAADGADMAFTYRTGNVEAKVITSQLRDVGRLACPIEDDLSYPEPAVTVVSTGVGELGPLEVPVDIAGVASSGASDSISLDEFGVTTRRPHVGAITATPYKDAADAMRSS